jgi:uncharacterized membrane protein
MAGGTTLARGLGLFSMGLGLYQLLAPREFDELIGVRPRSESETTTRAIGARELGAAAGLLASPLPVAFMWMRVAGDLMDLALLGRALGARENRQDRVGRAIASVAGITALDVVGSVIVTREAQRNGRANGHGTSMAATGSTTLGVPTTEATGGVRRVAKSITVDRPRGDVYGYWRDFTNLPRFMHHLETVEVLDGDGGRSRWRARAPLGRTVEWEAEITEDVRDERISWRSVEGSQVHNRGTVEFRDAPTGGTVVRVELEYDPPGGPLGVAIAKLSGEEPETQTSADLRRFKQVMETGEVLVSDATIGERRLRQRPARPPEPTEATA